MRSEAGREIFGRLIATADVFHHNMRNGVAERLHVDYATLQPITPTMIYCHTSGWGEDGPKGAWPGWDQFAQATGGAEWEGGACDEGNPPI